MPRRDRWSHVDELAGVTVIAERIGASTDVSLYVKVDTSTVRDRDVPRQLEAVARALQEAAGWAQQQGAMLRRA